MKIKNIIAVVLAIAYVQGATAAWLTVTNKSGKSLYVRSEFGGSGSPERKLVKSGETSSKFKSGAHSMSISWRAFDDAKRIAYGPRYTLLNTVPAATLTANIVINDVDNITYNWGLGTKTDADIDIFPDAQPERFK